MTPKGVMLNKITWKLSFNAGDRNPKKFGLVLTAQ